jgi:hypothetical protein
VIIVDANVLLHAYDSGSERHGDAARWLEEALSGDEPVGMPVVNLLAFIRISTNPRVLESPLETAEAIAIVESWMARPQVVMPHLTSGHWSILAALSREGQARGPMVMDAHVAALAKEHGAVICTTDRDFRRFDIKTIEPVPAS